MKNFTVALITLYLLFGTQAVWSQEIKPAAALPGPASIEITAPSEASKTLEINLKKPEGPFSVDLFTALSERRSTRSFLTSEVTIDELSAILWSANGVNRPDNGRTCPAVMKIYLLNVYVAGKDGIYLFDPLKHSLVKISDNDVRAKMGRQDFLGKASWVILITGDIAMYGSASTKLDQESKINFMHSNAGCLVQNVYLASAALRIGTVMVAGVNKEQVKADFKLKESELPLYVMPLGKF